MNELQRAHNWAKRWMAAHGRPTRYTQMTDKQRKQFLYVRSVNLRMLQAIK